jgi:hypothetical protein
VASLRTLHQQSATVLKTAASLLVVVQQQQGMRILAGNVGIGTNSPSEKLEINQSGGGKIKFSGATFYTSTIDMKLSANGNVGIGTAVPQTKLDVLGVASSTAFYANPGSASAAGYAFANSANTGLYSRSAGFLDLVAGGVVYADIGASLAQFGPILALGPTATGATYASFNTPSSGVLNVNGASGTTGNGTLIAGSIGVGTSSPFAKLSINNSTNDTGGQPLFLVASSTATATSTLFSILNSGSVGIGTLAPTGVGTSVLHVAGNGTAGANNFGSLTLSNPRQNTNDIAGNINYYLGSTEIARVTGRSYSGTNIGGIILSANKAGTLTDFVTLNGGNLNFVGTRTVSIGSLNGVVSGTLGIFNNSSGTTVTGLELGNESANAGSNISIDGTSASPGGNTGTLGRVGLRKTEWWWGGL